MTPNPALSTAHNGPAPAQEPGHACGTAPAGPSSPGAEGAPTCVVARVSTPRGEARQTKAASQWVRARRFHPRHSSYVRGSSYVLPKTPRKSVGGLRSEVSCPARLLAPAAHQLLNCGV